MSQLFQLFLYYGLVKNLEKDVKLVTPNCLYTFNSYMQIDYIHCNLLL